MFGCSFTSGRPTERYEGGRSVLGDGDRLLGALTHGLLDLGSQVVGRLLLEDVEEVVVAHLEDLGGDPHADGVALADVEIDYDLPGHHASSRFPAARLYSDGRCTKSGSRFSRKAAIASRLAGAPVRRAKTSSSRARADCAAWSHPSRISRFVSRSDTIGRRAMARAASSASSRSWSGGQDFQASPVATAVAASNQVPVSSACAAACRPIARGSVKLLPASGTTPRLANGTRNRASSATKTRSQYGSIVTPRPTARPLTAATSG